VTLSPNDLPSPSAAPSARRKLRPKAPVVKPDVPTPEDESPAPSPAPAPEPPASE